MIHFIFIFFYVVSINSFSADSTFSEVMALNLKALKRDSFDLEVDYKSSSIRFLESNRFLEGLLSVGKGGKISNIFFLFSCYLQKIVLIFSQSFPHNSRVLLLRQLCKRQLFHQLFNW